MQAKQKHKLIFSSRIAKEIIRDGRFKDNLVDIHENKDGSGRSIFVFREDDDFNNYLKQTFNIK